MIVNRIEAINYAPIVEVHEKWIKLIQFSKQHPYCKALITFKDGIPCEIEQAIETFKL